MAKTPQTPKDKREIVRLWFSEIWEKGNLAAIEELMAANFSPEALDGSVVKSPEDIPILVEVLHGMMGPPKVEIDMFLEEGDWICCCFNLLAPRPDVEQPLKVQGTVLFLIEGGKITGLRSLLNLFSAFEQTGQLPEDSIAGCLSGQKLVWA
ncbi:hypothetical protein RSK20926_17777 [Roseobacter sp. SK209-2-6]|uniref:nuclear transport factor 2 family protein n=1 Tax=Roseobacter sp. SK209-2-6 TaxID=388739 RepID=UPI0000F3F7CC|nr:nuclear transport factor 2 family protein [Roseobacter sp. SK209-2-6]EBA17612.1 hypothetical protein RSK20926_17777 [Roseobacter sp. SK209-2-6]